MFETYMRLRAVRSRLDESIRRERLAFDRLQKMQSDLPWWRGWMFIPMRAEHLKIRLLFSWTKLELWFWSLTLPARLRRLL